MADHSSSSRLAQWFHLWRDPLRRFLSSRGVNRVADLDDVSQEVFLRLLRYESREVVEHPKAYLYKVAANVAAEWAMRARHRFEHSSRELDTVAVEDNLDETFDGAVVQNEIKRAMSTLSPRQCDILRLYYEEGLDQNEVALRLGISYRVVRREFEKSYIKLRRELKVEVTGAFAHGPE